MREKAKKKPAEEKPRKRLSNEEIAAALIEEGSIKGAALSLGCNIRTLYARMKDPAFKEIYSKAKGNLLKNATAKLQGHLCRAIDTLAAIMEDEDTAKQTRANCPVAIQQYTARFTETKDIMERLEAIERIQEERSGGCA